MTLLRSLKTSVAKKKTIINSVFKRNFVVATTLFVCNQQKYIRRNIQGKENAHNSNNNVIYNYNSRNKNNSDYLNNCKMTFEI